jgi:hypothetical protein
MMFGGYAHVSGVGLGAGVGVGVPSGVGVGVASGAVISIVFVVALSPAILMIRRVTT